MQRHAFDFQVALAKYMDLLFKANAILNSDEIKENLKKQCEDVEKIAALPDQLDEIVYTVLEEKDGVPSIIQYVYDSVLGESLPTC